MSKKDDATMTALPETVARPPSDSVASIPPPPDERYEIKEELGSGGVGVVQLLGTANVSGVISPPPV